MLEMLHDNERTYVMKSYREVRLENALKIIIEWKDFPETGEYWDDDKTRPMSYGTWYGSNGERDYMREIARKAMDEKDKCVYCGCETEYSVNEHIDYRMFYVEGAGQLCKECWDKIYDKKKYIDKYGR